MPRPARLLAFAAGLALVLAPVLVVAPPAAADTSDFEFRSFHAEYTLTRDADLRANLDVVETAVAVFPAIDQNRGILRAIPDYYGNVNLGTRVLGVTDEFGNPHPYQVQDDGGFTVIRIGDPNVFVHGDVTYVIHYTQMDTIRYFADTDDDEFYWDVNGTGWEQPFETVSARLTLDLELSVALTGDLACFQGADGATDPCSGGVVATPDPSGGTVIEASAQGLAAGENLTIVTAFVAGTFVEGVPDPNGAPYDPDTGVPYEPDPPIDLGPPPPAWGILLSLAGWLALAIGIVGSVVLRRKKAVATSTIIPQYSVPKGLDVMIAAELIGKSNTALQAQFVSLAVKRKIRLLGYPVHDATTADYAVQLVDSTGLESWEHAVVTALFGANPAPGDSRDLQRAGDADLANALRPIVAALPGAVTASGFEGPKTRTPGGGWYVAAASILVVAGIVGSIAAGFVGIALGLFATTAGLGGIALAAFAARARTTLSAEGAQWVDYLLGMKMYLELAEKDRFRMLQSATGADRIDTADGRQIVKLYEKLLPWAVIWGIEDSWARELEIQLQQTGEQLDWYTGTGPFQSAMLLSTMSGLQAGTSAPAPVSSAGSSWSSSGGSSFSGGSSGGGFSGGGGGGGGGGGW